MRARSLRGRLLLVTVSLVAVGLVAANVATYVLLTSLLVGGIDERLRASRTLVTRALFEASGELPPGTTHLERGPRLRRGFPVTYVGLLDASGRVVVARSFGFGPLPSPPRLPADLAGGAGLASNPGALTVASEDGSLRYRALATPLADGEGVIVVAFPLDDVEATLRRLLLVEGLVSVVVLGAAGGLALWLVRLGLRPLGEMERTAAEIAAGDLSRRVDHTDPRTEVGRLGRALNVMLERIEEAFAQRRASQERLRRFVADASHELRSPLTSIRGYAELFRRGAAAHPDDLAKSMRRIEEEAGRMGELVEELLLLAHLDQGRPLARSALDLSRVAMDAVEDARTVQPERSIQIERPGPLIVLGDEARLRQVAANLLSNALLHTPPGAAVRVRVADEGEQAVLEVADEGPGLSPEHAARVFDRFYRADPARSRDGRHAGLGLAIVEAIVRAHGGEVRLETQPGRGARFVVRLPRTAEAGGETFRTPEACL